ncbi:hypothetical protein EJ07DRAFT_118057 [Lizonia empirigonia]|nr:hypothetical protein EJ07DRAFT_118057 [Lizonia empirigonia]
MSLDFYFRNSGISPENLPYASALSSSASSSTSSVFSDAASQASSTSSTSCPSNWEPDEWSSSTGQLATATAVNFSNVAALQPISRISTFPQYQASACRETAQERLPSLRQAELSAPVEQRQHPRRSSTTINQRAPPQLVRQSDRKVNFVDCLVDSATQMVEVIWQLSEPKSRCETVAGRGVLPLRTFIQETLRRSRTSYSTLQVALYYLILIKSHLPKHDFTMQQQSEDASMRALQCGRRMFLAALILASKYLQDRNYSARAWSKISGLKVCEINTNEMAFLMTVNWKLHITDSIWEKWQEVVLRHTPNPPSSPGVSLPNTWKDVIPILTPELEVITLKPKAAVTPVRRPFGPALSLGATRSPTSTGYGSQESTPTAILYQAPRFLEPKPDLLPPTPMRLGTLPTPSLTPQTIASSTPAASAMAMSSRRPSMCTAMQQAQCSSLARTCVDQFNPSIRNGLEAYHFPSRRPSLAPSVSSISSSPESMITDNSRSSRASSISSVSSAGWAPPSQASLARLATCRNAKLPYPVLSKCNVYTPSEPTSSPESVDRYQIDDVDATPMRVDSPLSIKSISPSRKRGRSSVDLQHSVRHLLNNSRPSFTLHSQPTVLPDRSIAQPSFSTFENELKGLQPPKTFAPDCSRLPVQKDFGKKRTCCSTEAAHAYHRQGPGMWDGVLL